MEIEIGDVIQEHYKGLECKLKGNPTNEAEFNANLTIYKTNGVETPTWAKVQSYLTEMQTAYDNNKYQRDRKAEYDQLNQFELIGEDSINGTTNHKDAILAIKAKYPKE